MKFEDQDEYIDRVAQAVIDRIEERETISALVNQVVARVIELQKEQQEEAELLAAQAEAGTSETEGK